MVASAATTVSQYLASLPADRRAELSRMGKACVRFKTADALAFDAVAGVISACSVETMIARHDAVHGSKKSAAKSRSKSAAKPAKSKRAAASKRKARA